MVKRYYVAIVDQRARCTETSVNAADITSAFYQRVLTSPLIEGAQVVVLSEYGRSGASDHAPIVASPAVFLLGANGRGETEWRRVADAPRAAP